MYLDSLREGKNNICFIDDRFPCNRNDQCVFWQVDSEESFTEMWPLMLEKAYAKVHECYEAINYGRPEQALIDLTNGIPEVISFNTKEFIKMKNDGSLWQKLYTASKESHLLWASSIKSADNSSKEIGILEGHSYSILFCTQVSK